MFFAVFALSHEKIRVSTAEKFKIIATAWLQQKGPAGGASFYLKIKWHFFATKPD